VKPARETSSFTGWLYAAEKRGRGGDDYCFQGHVRVDGRDYQVRVYGPQSVQGTTKLRWWLKLIPDECSR
jgi:hypothetical protein